MAMDNPGAGTADGVVVIGGGPGGSAAATMLARQGWPVTLVEREYFPRPHVGESLLPASIPVLEELGVLPQVAAQGFVRKYGATMVWGRDREPWSWFFGETNRRYPYSYQVWRPRFDQLLLDNAAVQGVDVRQGWQALAVVFDGPLRPDNPAGFRRGRAAGLRCRDAGGRERTLPAAFVVDASGQGCLLGRQLALRQWDQSFRNLAVYAYFAGAERLPAPAEGNIFIESCAGGWLWAIPLHNGQTSVGAVADQAAGERRVRQLGLARFLEEQLSQAPHTARMLRNARRVAGPRMVKDWSYACTEIAGDGYALLGDAACFIDPLFSSGVHLALMSGVLAAAYAATALSSPEMAPAAAQVYQELYLKEYHHFRELARLFYSSNRTMASYFWEARRILEEPDEAVGNGGLSPRASFIQAVAGQPPRGYERMVLERGQPPPRFTEQVRAVTRERARRQARAASLLVSADGRPAPALTLRPRLRPGVRVERKPVVGSGRFDWGYALVTAGHPEGLPCSSLVARLVALIDGQTPVSDLLEQLAAAAASDQRPRLAASVMAALQILYVDGAIEELDW